MKQAQRRRKLRQNVTKFDDFVAVPASGSFTLPASGKFSLLATSGSSDGQLAATITNNETTVINVPEMQAGDTLKVDHIEASSFVEVETGFDLLLDVGLGVYAKVLGGA